LFKSGDIVTLVLQEAAGQVELPNRVVERYEDGLLAIRDPDGALIVYNIRSLAFISAIIERRQEQWQVLVRQWIEWPSR